MGYGVWLSLLSIMATPGAKTCTFPSAWQVQIYEGDVWQAIRDATGDISRWLSGC